MRFEWKRQKNNLKNLQFENKSHNYKMHACVNLEKLNSYAEMYLQVFPFLRFLYAVCSSN